MNYKMELLSGISRFVTTIVLAEIVLFEKINRMTVILILVTVIINLIVGVLELIKIKKHYDSLVRERYHE